MAERYKQLGLIGKPLSHSFSKSYFSEKFEKLGINDFQYHHFELESVDEITNLLKTNPNLVGLNVTIPYKKEVMAFLDEISPEAEVIGAVNVIKIDDHKLLGFNSDYYGFKTSLLQWLPLNWQGKALILGTGGASLAVTAVLKDHNIPFQMVSRNSGPDLVTYEEVAKLNLLRTYRLVINTTPLGMQPDVNTAPDLNYETLTEDHYLFDLVYNPVTTRFMTHGISHGAKIKNGLEMLELQAEKSWDIWTGNK